MSHFSSASNLTVGTKTYKYFSMAGLGRSKVAIQPQDTS